MSYEHMEKIGSFLRNLQSAKDGNTNAQESVKRTITKLEEEGVSSILLLNATQKSVVMDCRFGMMTWRVLLLPTFHGLQVAVEGTDVAGVKQRLNQAMRSVFA